MLEQVRGRVREPEHGRVRGPGRGRERPCGGGAWARGSKSRPRTSRRRDTLRTHQHSSQRSGSCSPAAESCTDLWR